MKVRCIDGNWTNNELTTGKEYEALNEVGCYYQLKINDKGVEYHCYIKSRFEVINEDNKTEELSDNEIDFVQEIINECLKEKMKEENKMEKTFREVIADIKPGEVWICEKINRKIIKGYDGVIAIGKLYNKTMDNVVALIFSDEKYTLQRKEYTFEEAFKAYEDGKEVESCVNGEPYLKERDEHNSSSFFTFNQIRGKWYINN